MGLGLGGDSCRQAFHLLNRVFGNDARHACQPLDLHLVAFEHVDAPGLLQVLGREGAERLCVPADLGHQLSCSGGLGCEQCAQLLPLLLSCLSALLSEHRADVIGHHLLVCLGHGLQEVAGTVVALVLPETALEHSPDRLHQRRGGFAEGHAWLAALDFPDNFTRSLQALASSCSATVA